MRGIGQLQDEMATTSDYNPAAAPNQAQHKRGLAIMIEAGLVHRYQGLRAAAHLLRHPARKAVPHVYATIAQQPVHLLDRVLGQQVVRLGQSLTDHRNRQRRTRHNVTRGPGQRSNPFGMQIVAMQIANEPASPFKPSA